ncbi:hypothetical protein [Enterococcus sp. AZ129]|uniref:hypothetical protein n=1 Tax=unclassified Enterococcus TaxID=2608891 RepID=UPI003F278548
MSKALKWLETESERLEKECATNDDQFKTVNHSFIQGFNYALANVEVIELEESELNEKQEYLLRELICQFDTLGSPPRPFQAVYWLMNNGAWNGSSDLHKAITSLDNKQQAQVLRAFADWIEQEEK